MRTSLQVVFLSAFVCLPGAAIAPAQTPTPSPSPSSMQMEMLAPTPKPTATPSPTPMQMEMPMNMPSPTPTPMPAPTTQDTSGGRQETSPKLFPPPKDFPSPVEDQHRYTFFLADILEFRPKGSDSDISWDMEGWYGGDYNRFWFKSEGEKSTVESDYNLDLRLLYGRFIRRYTDFQVGIRFETQRFRGANVARPHAVIGLQVLVPYRYEIEPELYIDPQGNVSGRFEASRDYLMTQRWVLQPRIEANIAAQRVERFGVGRGLNDVELGFRLRYAVRREFAPYIGVSFERSFFGTADLVGQAGGDPSQVRFLMGVRLWR